MREKTDPIDALCLARMACVRPGRLEKERGELHRELVKLMDYRFELVEALRRHKIQMKKPSENEWIDRMRKETLEHLNNTLEELETRIGTHVGRDAELSKKLERMCQVKGVGKVVGWTLLAYLPELGELNRKEVAKLVGVAPLANESGEGARARQCGPGRAKLKAALWMASLSVIRFEEPFERFYERLKNKGKHSRVARVAVCRKLLVALNSIEASQSDYDPQMLFPSDSV
jgi:transposase